VYAGGDDEGGNSATPHPLASLASSPARGEGFRSRNAPFARSLRAVILRRMPRRLMSNIEVRLWRSLGFKGRSFTFHCPVCIRVGSDRYRATGQSTYSVPVLAVPFLPMTARCPQCQNELGCRVDWHTHEPELAQCDCGGAYAPEAHDDQARVYWQVGEDMAQRTILKPPYGVCVHVRCQTCRKTCTLTAGPVKGVPKLSLEAK
jgi:hypothetical protein